MASEFVQNIIDKVFGRPNSTSDDNFFSGPLERDAQFEKAFQFWKSSSVSSEVLEKIRSAYEDVAVNEKFRQDFHQYNSPQANGFFINMRLGISPESFPFLMDLFKERVLECGYSVYTSDRKYKESALGRMKSLDKHYLKPQLGVDIEVPINQRYGNVLLEYTAIDETPEYLKVMASVYSDRNYRKAGAFGELMEVLLREF